MLDKTGSPQRKNFCAGHNRTGNGTGDIASCRKCIRASCYARMAESQGLVQRNAPAFLGSSRGSPPPAASPCAKEAAKEDTVQAGSKLGAACVRGQRNKHVWRETSWQLVKELWGWHGP